MQLRMLDRRSLAGSMTVVGDIAQATAPWFPADWSDITRHLPRRRPPRQVELTVSYRTPSEVLDVAARVLAVAAPGLTPPRPVRRTGVPPVFVTVPSAPGEGESVTERLVRRVAGVAVAEVDAVAPGRVAVLAPSPLLAPLSAALSAAGHPVVDPRDMRRGGCPTHWCCWPPTPPTVSSSTPWWWSSPA